MLDWQDKKNVEYIFRSLSAFWNQDYYPFECFFFFQIFIKFNNNLMLKKV